CGEPIRHVVAARAIHIEGTQGRRHCGRRIRLTTTAVARTPTASSTAVSRVRLITPPEGIEVDAPGEQKQEKTPHGFMIFDRARSCLERLSDDDSSPGWSDPGPMRRRRPSAVEPERDPRSSGEPTCGEQGVSDFGARAKAVHLGGRTARSTVVIPEHGANE